MKPALFIGLFALAGVSLAVFLILFFGTKKPLKETYRFPEEETFFARAESAAKELGLSSFDPEDERLSFSFYPDNGGIRILLTDFEEAEVLSLSEVFSAAVYGYYPEGLRETLAFDNDGWKRFGRAKDLPEYLKNRIPSSMDDPKTGEWQLKEFLTTSGGTDSLMAFLRFVPDARPDRFSVMMLFSGEPE